MAVLSPASDESDGAGRRDSAMICLRITGAQGRRAVRQGGRPCSRQERVRNSPPELKRVAAQRRRCHKRTSEVEGELLRSFDERGVQCAE